MNDDSDFGPVLICCALEAEAAFLIREPGLARISVAAVGVGPARSRRGLDRILSEAPPRLLIFTGTAGGLDPSLAVGDVVLPEHWRLNGDRALSADPAIVELLRAKGWRVEGTGWTSATPVLGSEEKRVLFERSRARVCDMEAAVALDVAGRHKVPAIAVKIISDPAGGESPALTLRAFKELLPTILPKLARVLVRLLSDLGPRAR